MMVLGFNYKLISFIFVSIGLIAQNMLGFNYKFISFTLSASATDIHNELVGISLQIYIIYILTPGLGSVCTVGI